MANEERKDFNAMLHRETDMPRIQLVTDEATIRKYGGERMLLAPPLAYDADHGGHIRVHRGLGQQPARVG